MNSDTLPTRLDGKRLSSSPFSRQGWSRLSPSYAPPTSDAGPSRHADWRHDVSAPTESDLTHRSTSLHQANGDSRPLPRRDQPIHPATSRQPDTVPTQPVLVRAYSGNAEGSTTKSSNMHPRRLFPFSSLKSSAPSRPTGPPLPSDKDFSIESILQAIEPDIRGTLDSIADICGRSKLSLANEYGSHIAPLGEIRAPPGGLVPVEEASSSDERHDDGVVIFDDDPNIVDGGHDMHPFSFYRYLENLRRAASALEHTNVPNMPGTAQPTLLHTMAANNTPVDMPEVNTGSGPSTREYVSRPKHSGRDLLAKATSGSGENESLTQDMSAPAVASEIHLDAQADESHLPRNAGVPVSNSSVSIHATQSTWETPDVIRSLLSWLKWSSRIAGPENQHGLQSAESRLRAMLQQSAGDGTISPSI